MKRFALILLTLIFGLAASEASAYRTVEFQRCETRIIEHGPMLHAGPRKLYVETPCRSYRVRKIVRHRRKHAKSVRATGRTGRRRRR